MKKIAIKDHCAHCHRLVAVRHMAAHLTECVAACRAKLAEQRRGAKFETFTLMLLLSLQRAGVEVRRCTYMRGDELVSKATAADFVQVHVASRHGATLSTDSNKISVFVGGGTVLYRGTSFNKAVAALKAARAARTLAAAKAVR